jgi:hypothetical protein
METGESVFRARSIVHMRHMHISIIMLLLMMPTAIDAVSFLLKAVAIIKPPRPAVKSGGAVS